MDEKTKNGDPTTDKIFDDGVRLHVRHSGLTIDASKEVIESVGWKQKVYYIEVHMSKPCVGTGEGAMWRLVVAPHLVPLATRT
ncbi:unnamed protein product [Schistocephalus solidus]|uniref:FmdE domain-containing protein n=1 Tax=Schistocephalus solidus TaxID=70667 RepID=A0A183T2X4_SCHSO|nr:unnamed protein product [Schistocephalus solidus]